VNRRQSAAGFTLIEVVVAFAIFAVCIGPVLAAFAGATRHSHQARRQEMAVLVAQSVLASIRATEDFGQAVKTGSEGRGIRWRAEIAAQTKTANVDGLLSVYSVAVSVFDVEAETPIITLRSLELELGRGKQ
jgi:general secretion pathway protein I